MEISIYLARKLVDLSCCKLAEYFGNVSVAAITMKYKRFSCVLTHDKRLNKSVTKLSE
ncbi:MAG: hypothetical protein KQH63_09695 [Desulfobulbaceae bacterium]|nr:hypothetical protein [Desulfobulbaceae bacterium]